MSDYTKTTDFAAKDALASGNAAKVAKGTEVDTEFDNIATAIATKYDATDRGAANGIAPLDASSLVPVANLPDATTTAIGAVELATNAETVTGTDTARAVTPAGVEAWAAQNAGFIQQIADLTAPAEDRLLGYSTSLGAQRQWTAGTGLQFLSTSLATDDSAIVHDDLSGFVANEHINHANVDVLAGSGLTGGGSIDSNLTLTLGTPTSLSLSSTNSVTSTSHTHALSAAGIVRTEPGTGGEITVTTVATPSGGTNGDMWLVVDP